MKEPLTILITGVGGYLGSVLVRKLLNETDYFIKGFDNFLYGEEPIKELDNPRLTIIKDDLRNMEAVIQAVEGVDVVIHLAAIVGDQACALTPEVTQKINVGSTRFLAEQAKIAGVKQFLYASTCSVYGARPYIWIDEKSAIEPVSLYGETKRDCEELLAKMDDDDFIVTTFRMSTLFGLSPRMRFDLAINVMTANAYKNGSLTLFGGDQWRPFLHVQDAADGYLLAIENPVSGIFNLGSNFLNYNIKSIGSIIRRELPGTEVIIKEEGDRRDYKVNCDLVKKTFGFLTSKSVVDGVKETHDYLKERPNIDITSSDFSNFKYLASDDEMKDRIYRRGPI